MYFFFGGSRANINFCCVLWAQKHVSLVRPKAEEENISSPDPGIIHQIKHTSNIIILVHVISAKSVPLDVIKFYRNLP